MQTVIDDRRLVPIRDKVIAGERLSSEDGLALFRTTDILSLGYLANIVRERLHGDTTYFNVNRHINPTDVCVASCKLCAFGKLTRDGKAYTRPSRRMLRVREPLREVKLGAQTAVVARFARFWRSHSEYRPRADRRSRRSRLRPARQSASSSFARADLTPMTA